MGRGRMATGMSLKVSTGLGAPAGFVPSGSPAGWWAADQITGLSDGDPVGTWPDLSGNNNHLVQAVGASKPTYKTGIQNGLPILRFDGLNDFIGPATFAMTQPETVFVVLKQTTWTLDDAPIDGSTMYMILAQRATTPRFSIYGAAWGCENSALAIGSFGILTALWNGASSYIRINGGNQVTGNAGAGFDGGGIMAGRRHDVGAFYFDGDIAEIVAYNSNETPTDNEAGLNGKYAIY